MTADVRRRSLYALIAFGVIALDQWTKFIIRTNFRIHWDSVEVIPGFFRIVHIRNTGAAFGIGAQSDSPLVPIVLNVLAIAVFVFVLVLAYRSSPREKALQIGLHLILGGAVGNLIDRFTLGSVVDFLDVFVVIGGEEKHWPAFNVADSAICVGIGLLLLDMWLRPSDQPLESTENA
ncbi:MAG: signal peptidase II [Thermoanaerobaculia bacterium]|nr:signal peptidase II [Thermoanaerobaculia bacterium]